MEHVYYVSIFFAKKDIIKYFKKIMASFKYLKDLSIKIVIWLCVCMCVALKNLSILIIDQFLANMAKKKSINYQKKKSINYKKCKYLDYNINVKFYL